MEIVDSQFFPFPHVVKGKRRPGSVVDWPDRCGTCDRHCENRGPGLGLCSYGLNYYRIDDELLVAGVVLRDFPRSTPARQKMLRRYRRSLVNQEDLSRVVALVENRREFEAREAERSLTSALYDHRHSDFYYDEILRRLQPQLRKAVGQVHDYKQFVRQIIQNLDVILEDRFPNRPLHEKIDLATPEEAAIYWAAQMMDGKLDAVAFLEDPERITQVNEMESFRLDEIVIRYVQIYQRFADKKRIRLRVYDQSNAEIIGNARALRVIPHTLIDNAITYAPPDTDIELVLRQRRGTLVFTVESFGPLIADTEMDAIFDPFVRGAAARHARVEGYGFGLAAAQAIAVAHNSRIQVSQSQSPTVGDCLPTTFSVPFSINWSDD
jgi:signal transduction histidine kinase